MNNTRPNPDARRPLALIFSVLMIAGGLWLKYSEGDSAMGFASMSLLRVGIVLGVIWIAWPSLRRPAQWLPPGIAGIIVLTLCAIAAQPRLILVIAPVVGGLLTLGAIVRALRSLK